MCLVLGHIAGALANMRAALLSSNILHLTVGWVPPTGTPLSLSSCTRSIMGIATFEDIDLLRVQEQLGVLAGQSTLVDLQHQAEVSLNQQLAIRSRRGSVL
jgi:hypothetical protein